MHFTSNAPSVVSEVRTFVLGERRHCVSDREWEFRLRGYGYGIRRTDRGTMLHTLPQGQDICTLD